MPISYLLIGLGVLLVIGLFSDDTDWLPPLLIAIFWPIVLLLGLYCHFKDWRTRRKG